MSTIEAMRLLAELDDAVNGEVCYFCGADKQAEDNHIAGCLGGQIDDYMADRHEFRKDIEQIINRHSMENGSNTPDWILATYLQDCLASFDKALRQRDKWYGKRDSITAAEEAE